MTTVAAAVANRGVGRVALVEEFDDISPMIEAMSKEDGFELVRARSTPQLMRALSHGQLDLVLLDVGMAERATTTLIDLLGTMYPGVSIVAVAGDRQAALLSVKAGACFALSKPLEYAELRRALRLELEPR